MICGTVLLVFSVISACIITYELRVQKHLKKWKDKDWRYDG